MNATTEFKKPVAPDLKLFEIEIDVSDVTNLLNSIHECVNGMELEDKNLQAERERVTSLIRATTGLASRALASLETYRTIYPDPD